MVCSRYGLRWTRKRSGGAFARRSVDQVAQKLAGDHAGRFGLQPGEDELGGSVDRHEQMQFALFGPDFSA